MDIFEPVGSFLVTMEADDPPMTADGILNLTHCCGGADEGDGYFQDCAEKHKKHTM